MTVSKRSWTGRHLGSNAIMLVASVLALRAALADGSAHLAPGATAELQVDPERPARLVLDVGQNKAGFLLVDHDEASLQLRILSELGREVRTASAGSAGMLLVSLPPSNGASLQLVATVTAALRSPVTLTVSMEPSRPLTSDLSARWNAERIFRQAQILRREPSARSLHQAIDLFREAREQWRSGRCPSGQAVALAAEGDIWFQLSSYAAAHRAYSAARQFVKPDSRLAASLLNAESALDLELWQRESAREAAELALAISGRLHDGRGEADALANQAIARWLLSEDDAGAALKNALEAARSSGNRVAAARVLSVEGWLERDLGHRSEAIKLMDQSAQFFQETGRPVDAIGETLDVALTEGSGGDADSAIVTHARLVKLFHKAGSVFNEAQADNNLGLDYIALNRARDALQYFREARRLFTATGNVWAAQTSLGLTCETELSLRLYRTAQPDCDEAKRISDKFHAPLYIALADSRLGKLAEARREFAHAMKYYYRAAELTSAAGYSLGAASANMSLGLLQYTRAGPGAAMDYFKKALSLSQQAEDPAGIIEANYQIARVYAGTNRLDDAQSQLEDATSLSESEREKIRSDTLRSSYFSAVRKCYDLYVEVLMRRHASDPGGGFDRQALEKSEAARARTLFDALHVKAAWFARGTAKSADLARLRAALNEKYEARLNLISGGKQRELEANAEEIRRLSAQYDQAIVIASAVEPLAVDGFAPIGADDLVRASLDTVILEYHLTEKRSYLWRIERGAVASFTLPGRKTIGEAVEKWRELASARQRRPAESFVAHQARVEAADRDLPVQSAKLSCMLLAGLPLEKGARLTIIADGSLQSLPFAALPSNGCRAPHGPPLVMLHDVANAPSLRLLTSAKSLVPLPHKKEVAILADPVFSAHDARFGKSAALPAAAGSPPTLKVALRDAGFPAELPRLWGTREEANAIAALAPSGSARRFLDFEANLKTALSAELSNYRIWHFATHGLLDQMSPELSGLVFSLVDSARRPIPGYLNIQDILGLSIDPDLVVLSACNSGLGEQVEGEGSVGLSYAFLHAGAKQVLSTLWSIDDNASSYLMTEFYRGLLRNHLTPAGALRKAQIAMLRSQNTSQPFYWAGYLLMSN